MLKVMTAIDGRVDHNLRFTRKSTQAHMDPVIRKACQMDMPKGPEANLSNRQCCSPCDCLIAVQLAVTHISPSMHVCDIRHPLLNAASLPNHCTACKPRRVYQEATYTHLAPAAYSIALGLQPRALLDGPAFACAEQFVYFMSFQ